MRIGIQYGQGRRELQHVVIHDSRNASSLKPLSKTSRGTELSFNSHLFDAGGIVPIGSVEPHYFAGLTGGTTCSPPQVT
jgi:nickel-dependent lactate racemase